MKNNIHQIYSILIKLSKETSNLLTENMAQKLYITGILLTCAFCLAAKPALAIEPSTLPSGAEVVSGSADITTNGNTMTINQHTDRMIANWDTFNIGQDATVTFNQPGTSSVSLNRIFDQNPSQIFGNLNANGQVFLLNPSGVYFGPTAQVNVGGLVASSLNLSDSNFLDNEYLFENVDSTGIIKNDGTIHASDYGYVAFISPQINNNGNISAQNGVVSFAAGNKVSLDFTGDRLVNFIVDQSAVNALVENKGLIRADGGMVMLTAKASNSLTSLVVNNEGVIEANTISEKNGRIILDSSDTGITRSTGTISAIGDNTGETGGNITITGNKVGLFGEATMDVSGDAGGGTINIGGGFQGKDKAIRNAKKTVVDTSTVIRANAGSIGNGGEVVVWADDTTRFHGSIETKGGMLSGNGGKVEVSGKGWLDFQGRVDTTATQGQGGSLLLDPTNIIVATADPGGGAVSRSLATELDAATDNPAETSWITPSSLVGLLNTANVNFQAYNDITFSNAVDATANSGNFGLTMTAGRNILINDNITLRGGFTATANSTNWSGTNRGAGAGNFTIADGKIIDTTNQNGAITIGVATQDPLGMATIEGLRSGSGTIQVQANSLELTGGANSIIGTGDVTIKPQTASRPVVIGAAGTGNELALDATEFSTLADGFSVINLGSSSGTGLVTVSGNLNFHDRVAIQSSGVGGSITLNSDAAITSNGNELGFFAGTGDTGILTQTSGATITAGNSSLNLKGDNIILNGNTNSIQGVSTLYLQTANSARPIIIGSSNQTVAGSLAFTTAELDTFKNGCTKSNIGQWSFNGVSNSNSGGITVQNPVTFYHSAGLYGNGAGATIAINAYTAVEGGTLYFWAGGPIQLNASLRGSAGVSFQNNITVNADNLTVDAGTGSATFNPGGYTVNHGAHDFTVTADFVELNGNWFGTGARILQPTTTTRTIGLGSGGGVFSLDVTELGYLSNDSPSSVTIGRSGGSGAIAGGAFSFNDPFILRGGAITQSGAWTLSNTTSLTSSGNITLTQAGNDFGNALSVSGNNVSLSDINNLSLGTATVSGNLTAEALAGDLTVSDNIVVSGGSANTTMTLKATQDITFQPGSEIDATGNGANKTDVTLWSDSNAVGGGAILLDNGSAIKSNGGFITLSGGLNLATGYAQGRNATNYGNGIFIYGSDLNSAGGAITLRGKGAGIPQNHLYNTSGSNRAMGIYFYKGTINSGTGKIILDGVGTAVVGSSESAHGIQISAGGNAATLTSANTSSDAITLNGNASTATHGAGATGEDAYGVFLSNPASVSATGTNGGIVVNATGTSDVNMSYGSGFRSGNGSSMTANGPINITATGTGGDQHKDVWLNGGIIGSASSFGGITMNMDTLHPTIGASQRFYNAGTITILPRSTDTSIGINGMAGILQLPATLFSNTFVNGFSSIIVGRADGTGKITAGAFTVNDNLTLLNDSGGIELAGLLNANGNTVILNSTGSVTDTGSGAITAGSLAFLGTGGSFTIDSANNNVGTFAADTGNVTYVDSNALTIGTVNPSGISATGPVNIFTLSGDLTVSQNIATSDTSASAIVLNAGMNTAAGISSDGNIIISGASAISTGPGGRTTIYTGSLTGSTGLIESSQGAGDGLIGFGSGRFRYNSDETATNFTTVLGSSGIYAIYREQPLLTFTADNETKTYGSTPSATSTLSGLQNGDTNEQAITTAPSVSFSGSTSTSGKYTVGSHTLTPSGALGGLGYGFNYSTGILNVTQKTLNISGLTASNKVYDSTINATVDGSSALFIGLVNGDDVAVSATGTFDNKNIGTEKTVNLANSYSGLDKNNYSITGQASTTANIIAKAITISGVTASNKVYDGTTIATTNVSSASYTGLVNGDDVAVSTTGTFENKNVGTSKTVTLASAYSGTDKNNYSITDQATTTADITAATLMVTANNDYKQYSGIAYYGGNGVTYSGFVNGETSSVLDGILTYGGTSQGAITSGEYTIIPSGLISSNYDVLFNNGTLKINVSTPEPVNLISPQASVNGTQMAESFETGNAGVSIIGPGGGSLLLANYSGSNSINDFTLSSENLILSSGTFILPVNFKNEGSTLTMNMGKNNTSETLVETGILHVLSRKGSETVTKGSFIVKESQTSLSLTATTVTGITQDIGSITKDELPFTISMQDGINLNLSFSLTDKGFMIITASELPETIDISQVILAGMMMIKNEYNIEINNLKGALIIQESGISL